MYNFISSKVTIKPFDKDSTLFIFRNINTDSTSQKIFEEKVEIILQLLVLFYCLEPVLITGGYLVD